MSEGQTKSARMQEEVVKRMIVDGYRRGVCTADGGHIPVEHRGMSGKGSAFIFKPTQAYRDTMDRVFGKKRRKGHRKGKRK